MGRFFAPDFGDFEITGFTHNGSVTRREVRFSVPTDQWPEFEKSDLYRYLKGLAPDLELIAFYSDNVTYCQEVRFSLPIETWSEFESSPMYQQLEDFVHRQEIPGKPPRHHGGGLEWEIDGSSLHSMCPAHRESFWAKVRRMFRGT